MNLGLGSELGHLFLRRNMILASEGEPLMSLNAWIYDFGGGSLTSTLGSESQIVSIPSFFGNSITADAEAFDWRIEEMDFVKILMTNESQWVYR